MIPSRSGAEVSRLSSTAREAMEAFGVAAKRDGVMGAAGAGLSTKGDMAERVGV